MKILVLGAGVLGSAVACVLSRKNGRQIEVWDADLEGELSSSERNAGGVRHLWEQPENIALARQSISFFAQHPQETGFRRVGYLWLFSKAQAALGERVLAHAMAEGLSYARWEASQIQSAYPWITETEDLSFAAKGPGDGLLNANALKLFFRTEAQRKGVSFCDRRWCFAVEEKLGEVTVSYETLPSQAASHARLKAPLEPARNALTKANFDRVILCTGAWGGTLQGCIGLESLLRPIRRQIVFFQAEQLKGTEAGMTIDPSGVYFHPEGGDWLAGLVLKTEGPGYRFEADPDFFETHIWPNLYHRSRLFERMRPLRSWAGLYSYTPDTSGILGKVPHCERIFEAHSFTGRGVMQSYGAALAIDQLLEGEVLYPRLSRDRFRDPNGPRLLENLHI